MQKSFIFYFLKYCGIFFCFFVFCNANILGAISPFAIGCVLALVWNNQKLLAILPLYFLATLLYDFSLPQIVATIIATFVILLFCGIHKKIKKPIPFNLFIFYTILAQSGYLFSQIYFNNQIIFPILSVLCATLFMVNCKIVFSVITSQQNIKKFSIPEKICLFIFISALSCGLENIIIFGVPILQIFAPLVLLFFSQTKNISSCVLLASVIGVGSILSSGIGTLMAPIILCGLVAGILGGAPKIVSAILITTCDFLCGYFLNLYPVYSTTNIIMTSVGALIFVAIPQKIINDFAFCFSPTNNVGLKSVVNRNRESLCKRLNNLSDVFGELDYVFRSTIKDTANLEMAKKFLIDEVKNRVCANCPERNICHRKYADETSSVLDNMMGRALERGKTTLLDAPAYLTTRCGRLSNLVGCVNGLCVEYKNYANAMNNIDASKVMIADELRGVSMILKNLASEVNKNISLDCNLENQIISKLAFYNITCGDAVIYEENLSTTVVTLLIRKSDIITAKISEVVSKLCKQKMEVVDTSTSENSGWNIVTLKNITKLNLAFGTASVKKDGSKISGDTYSIIKISHNKFLLALCDGMGSGENAEKTSSLAIGLVENFYKAGFDNEIILSSINKLLSIGKEDIFSTLDICVLDTQNETCDFIKMGAPESFIKHQHTTTLIEGGTLPLGIVQEIRPLIKKEIISSNDYIFMFTDGVTESFATLESLHDYINNLTILNPQQLAEEIINKAIKLSNGARDDMTVIVAKIFKNK